MRYELFIALRYLTARRKQTFISVISLISILGVALGVASLIVVMGVMNGFSNDLREKILGVNAHVVVMSLDNSIDDPRGVREKVLAVDGVAGATPFLYSEVMLSSPNGVKGVVLRGIDPATAGGVLGIERDMTFGSLDDLDTGGGPPGIVVGHELAQRLGLTLGSRVNLLSPTGRTTAAGYAPKVQIHKVVGVFRSGLFEYDATLAFTTIGAAAELMGVEAGSLTGLELKVDDIYAAPDIAARVGEKLGYPYYVRHWAEMNANLFAALKLEKTAMFIILTLIVLVGSFSIVTTLVMLVMEKTRDIAILMSMGAKAGGIRRVFMLQGLIIGAVGTALGYALGIGLALLLKRYQFVELPKNVYPVDRLPVLLEWPDMALVGVAAMVLCFLATIYPARQAANLEPVEALRHE